MNFFKKHSLIFIFLGIIALVGLIYYKFSPITPEKYFKNKYTQKEEYTLLKETKDGNYSAYLSKYKEDIYLDIFHNNGYLGGMEVDKDNRGREEVHIFNFIQEKTLIIIFSENTSNIREYELKVESDKKDPKIITKKTDENSPILDIHLLDKEYNSFPEIKTSK
ncbi:hypothetical protein [Miniphocaeibacter halophilus]|uniref:Uncharacterized protein n=1 Tax=Miniphocaeibacter halophilus TaxID=2931922 RepID=A0AC61MRI4_9FIRM|nr:hypothetical protein [Miniphocaeibacter halophilus]QQK06873.1 hypothetical protein JFY71_05860 [Miniphocaeibacter halophilus]